ncbi:RNA polymerase sigma factor [Chitinophaga agrisoli]|uniref:RNA polymerase sigma factor n=1 Tax=Chitinophaga agrisoli TaxID=2607653 RepID=A0A5B2VQ97_9BACT|nr:RNA polymerase sigma factor [Chitinophaga agrisoli]KAA2240880.1 RNA polymerase sigma factor [Chitinophaga agrisoli]
MDEQPLLTALQQHQDMLHKICRLYRDTLQDREDLFQEIIYQVWKAYPSFEGQAKLSSWIYRVALNTALATFRRKQPQIIYPTALPEQAVTEDAAALQQEQLFAALKQLNDGEKAIIALYLEDMSYQEIAAITGIDENYVGVKLHRIKNKLRTILKQ